MASPLRLHGGKLIMKHISITYHMSREGEIAETCIILPMEDQIASDILEHQEESRHVREDGCGTIAVRTILTCLAELQGYTDASFCNSARHVKMVLTAMEIGRASCRERV